MAPTPVRDGQVAFTGGLNTVTDPIMLSPDQYRAGINARHTEYGALTKRNGSIQLALTPLPVAIQGGTMWQQDSGNVYAFVVAGGLLWRITPLSPLGSLNWTLITNTP
jgi:hypothetical protein